MGFISLRRFFCVRFLVTLSTAFSPPPLLCKNRFSSGLVMSWCSATFFRISFSIAVSIISDSVLALYLKVCMLESIQGEEDERNWIQFYFDKCKLGGKKHQG